MHQATRDYIVADSIVNADILALGVTMLRRLPHLLLEFHELLDASKVGQVQCVEKLTVSDGARQLEVAMVGAR